MQLKLLDLLLKVCVAKESLKVVLEFADLFLYLRIDCVYRQLDLLVELNSQILYLRSHPLDFLFEFPFPLLLGLEEILDGLLQKVDLLSVGLFAQFVIAFDFLDTDEQALLILLHGSQSFISLVEVLLLCRLFVNKLTLQLGDSFLFFPRPHL